MARGDFLYIWSLVKDMDHMARLVEISERVVYLIKTVLFIHIVVVNAMNVGSIGLYLL